MFHRHHQLKPSLTARRFGVAAAALAALAMLVPACASADAVARRSSADRQAGPPAMKSAAMKAGGSGISIQYRVDGTPEVGATVRVVMTFDGITDPAGATLHMTTEGGLTMGAAPTTLTLPAGRSTTITVDLVPSAQGIAYLHVFTAQSGASSATSIAVQVGKAPAALPAAQDLKQDAHGDQIRSMQVK
jgi:hypothetical protein